MKEKLKPKNFTCLCFRVCLGVHRMHLSQEDEEGTFSLCDFCLTLTMKKRKGRSRESGQALFPREDEAKRAGGERIKASSKQA